MTYAGARKIGRYAYKKCHPEPESSASARNRSIDESEKRQSECRTSTRKEYQYYSSKHHSQDMSSSITQVQEPEKAYSTDVGFTVRTSRQPTPIDPMNLPPDFVPKPIFKAPAQPKRLSLQSNVSSQAPIIPLPTLSPNYDSRSPRRQSGTTSNTAEMGSGKEGASHSQCHAVSELAQDSRPQR